MDIDIEEVGGHIPEISEMEATEVDNWGLELFD